MKRIISFCIYGSDPKYADAAILNVELQPTIYPGWTCRFYLDDSVPINVIDKLKGFENVEFSFKNVLEI